MQSVKLLITTGKMPAARKDRMSTSGLWLLNSFLRAATALAKLLLLRNLLLLRRGLQPKSLNNFSFFSWIYKALLVWQGLIFLSFLSGNHISHDGISAFVTELFTFNFFHIKTAFFQHFSNIIFAM